MLKIVDYGSAPLYFTLLILSTPSLSSNNMKNGDLPLWLKDSPTTARSNAQWNPPLPISDLFYSPCNFPTFPSHHQRRQQHSMIPDATRICHGNNQAPFLCDLHRYFCRKNFYDFSSLFITLSHYSIQSLVRIYHKHLPVLRQNDGSTSILILIVRQLIQPTSTNFVTSNSSEFGCLFKIPCEPMTPETIQNFVKSIKAFTRIYASALYNRWFPPLKNSKGCNPRILALVVLEGVLSYPRKVTSVTLYTGNHVFATYIANIQIETTNMLLQGVPVADVVREMIDQIGHSLKQFHITRGKFRRYSVPPWAWKLALSSITLVILSLILEWMVVRRAGNRKMRGYELGKIKSVIKGKTHMIF